MKKKKWQINYYFIELSAFDICFFCQLSTFDNFFSNLVFNSKNPFVRNLLLTGCPPPPPYYTYYAIKIIFIYIIKAWIMNSANLSPTHHPLFFTSPPSPRVVCEKDDFRITQSFFLYFTLRFQRRIQINLIYICIYVIIYIWFLCFS